MNCLARCASALLPVSLGWCAAAHADCHSAWSLGANANDTWSASCISSIPSFACEHEVAEDFDFTRADRGALGSPRVAGEQLATRAGFRDPPAPLSTNPSHTVHFVLAS